MKIAVTADAHLRAEAGHPERYNALENVFAQTVEAGIENLIIAGDLFDKDFQDYSKFEKLCRNHTSLQLHIIPGIMILPSVERVSLGTTFISTRILVS